MSKLTDLPHEILASALKAGMDTSEDARSGSFFHVDQDTIYSTINEAYDGKLEIMDVKDAAKRHDWFSDYWWNAVAKDKDDVTEKVAKEYSGGYFMRILEGAEIDFPLQSCLMMTKKDLEQKVHNVIIAEKGSSARIISGCVVEKQAGFGRHLGVSEFYVKQEASLNFTMIHNWSEDVLVRPRSAALVDSGGSFVSNYILMQPVADLQMYPEATCAGEGSKARFNNIFYVGGKSRVNAGSVIDLRGEGSSGEIISRAIAYDESEVVAPGRLLGNNKSVKAHMECRGLLLNDGAVVHAIPELYSRYVDVDLSHEAAVGKIADKEINYLMSRGINKDEATSLIVRGFLDVDILGLPEGLRDEVDGIVDSLVEGM